MEQAITELEINGTKYVRADSVKEEKPNGNRCVVVVDRGWIFAGDVEEKDGRIYLTRTLHVRRWEGLGFDGMVANPKDSKVTLKPIAGITDIPESAEVFRVHVSENWGL